MIVDSLKRILFVIDGLEFGGGERVFLQLAKGLNGRFKIIVAAVPGGELEQGVRQLGIRFHPVDLARRFSLKPVFQIRDIIRSNRICLVHSQGARADFFVRVAGKISGVRHIICTIAMPVEGFDVGSLRKMIYRFMDRVSGGYVEHFIVVSDSLKQLLVEKRGIPEPKVARIYNGIELGEYRPNLKEVRSQKSEVRREFGLGDDVPVIGAIGRMVWQKGFEYLIKAIPAITKEFLEAKVLIVGEGPLKGRLEALGVRLKVKKNLVFTGFRSDVKEILSAIDILVIPSVLEGFPMITLEGMAMAKPIVATNIEGITEQITNGENGILVPPRDPSALAKAIIGLLRNRETARRMGLAARKKTGQEFSVEKMVSETEKLYLSLLNSNFK
jgi:glycosyltransferase involved in cell wall biosynthesis